MIKTYRYKMRPTVKQAAALDQTLYLCRNLYNCALEQRRGQRVSQFEQMRQVTDLRQEFAEYKTVHVHILQNVLKNLNRSFESFFRRCREGKKPGFPRFKGTSRYNSFSFNNTGFALAGRRLQISKVGSVRLHLSRELPKGAKVKSCTVKRQNGSWFACLVVEYEPEPLPVSNKRIGIDVGIEHLAALSDGSFIANPRVFEASQSKLRRAQRRVVRRKKGSHGRRKAVVLLRKVHKRIANQRLDFLHKRTTELIKEHGTIVVENLNVKGLAQGTLRKQVHDVSWAMFFNLLAYKAEEAGRELIEVDARYTSQTCPGCARVKKKLLSERKHKCGCGYEAHRDTAAAQIILARAGPSGAKIGELIPCLA